MAHRVPVALAGPDFNPLPAHPCPDAHAWGDVATNVSSFTATAAEAHIHTPNPSSTLIQIYVDGPCRMLANGGADIAATGYPLAAAGYFSFSIRAGSPISFQAVGADVAVAVLEG